MPCYNHPSTRGHATDALFAFFAAAAPRSYSSIPRIGGARTRDTPLLRRVSDMAAELGTRPPLSRTPGPWGTPICLPLFICISRPFLHSFMKAMFLLFISVHCFEPPPPGTCFIPSFFSASGQAAGGGAASGVSPGGAAQRVVVGAAQPAVARRGERRRGAASGGGGLSRRGVTMALLLPSPALSQSRLSSAMPASPPSPLPPLPLPCSALPSSLLYPASSASCLLDLCSSLCLSFCSFRTLACS